MTVGAVAKADLRQTGRSWQLLGLAAGIGFFFAGAAAIFVTLGRLPGGESSEFAGALVSPLRLLCPLVGVLIGYPAIVGERASGTIRLLLSLPHSRFEVVLGKLLSRVFLVSVLATLGATVGYVSLHLFGGSVGVLAYATVILLAVLLGTTFVTLSIGLSAGLESETAVAAASLGSVVLFTTLWQVAVGAVDRLFSALGVEATTRAVTQTLTALNPVVAFSLLASTLLGVESRLGPFQGEWWSAVLVVLCWGIGPLLAGLWRFERAPL